MEVLLVGTPNVGKSVVFSRLTGVGAISSNYPGTTVDYLKADMMVNGRKVTFIDLPGLYSLTGGTEDQRVAAQMLRSSSPDCVLLVADATRLEPSLVLLFQLIELGHPVLVAMNMMDSARKRGELDIARLSAILDVPIVPTVAITGEGMGELLKAIEDGQARRSTFRVRYDSHIEAYLEVLRLGLADFNLERPVRGVAIRLLEGDDTFAEGVPEDILTQVERLRKEFRKEHGEDLEVHINRDRYGEAGRILSEVYRPKVQPRTLGQKLSDLTLRPRTGVPILLAVLSLLLATIIGLGSWLEEALLSAYASVMGTFFADLAAAIGGELGIALASGLDLSLQAILAVVVPYILLFYLLLAVLEDSGYLPRVVVLMDGVMHRLGLHGQAIIPMLVGMGCNVPAILATRTVESRRERLILGTIIVMAVPCSAQMAVIVGTVGRYGGPAYVLAILVILLCLVLLLGRLLNRALRFEPTGLMIEIPDLAVPRPRNVAVKTWMRIKEFFVIAFPILLAGSIALELLAAYGVLAKVVEPLAFFTEGLLGLPAITIIALLFGILRKEMSFQLLVVLFGTADLAAVMTVQQLFV
ncbi:MAG TPA: ferrous iron transport protein B, partial [Methanomassiliicoccales archaeon]|nr:ferrous iron transport protein B [Methanomassiliicoccales archaeon]